MCRNKCGKCGFLVQSKQQYSDWRLAGAFPIHEPACNDLTVRESDGGSSTTAVASLKVCCGTVKAIGEGHGEGEWLVITVASVSSALDLEATRILVVLSLPALQTSTRNHFKKTPYANKSGKWPRRITRVFAYCTPLEHSPLASSASTMVAAGSAVPGHERPGVSPAFFTPGAGTGLTFAKLGTTAPQGALSPLGVGYETRSSWPRTPKRKAAATNDQSLCVLRATRAVPAGRLRQHDGHGSKCRAQP
ncbi:uncharacterized protein [Dermacentor andersoni]|uniref:uncharacterized protein n=1 Tax=Dermacentor andersoni TaxID=34620 RepID=UPI003B3A9EB7